MKLIVARWIRVSLAMGLALLLTLLAFAILIIEAAQTSDNFNVNSTYLSLPAQAVGPLPNGVAAGDTSQTSTVLWTRGTIIGPVLFEVSTNPTFSAGVVTATATVTDPLQPVKVTLNGLSPATTYFYRATDAGGAFATGQFHTATTIGTRVGLRFGVSGDNGGHLAPYPALSNADERNLHFFVELGDTTYSDVSSPALNPAAITANDFRLKYNEIYSTHYGLNTWTDLHASTSVLSAIDDHEVRNDFAGGAEPSSDPRFDNTGNYINETQLYNTALQVFQEYKPIQNKFYGATGDPRTANKRQLYRFNTYGSDAAVFILDTRSFRNEPLPLNPTSVSSITTFLNTSLSDTSRTFLGAQQLADLKADLQQAQTQGLTWKFILVSGPIQNLGVFAAPDRYEGYAAERTDLLKFITDNNIENVVFIAASLHGTIVNNLTYQTTSFGPQIPTTAFEVIAGPIAIYPPFGPAVVALAENFGLLTPAEVAAYNNLSRADKDEFVRQLMDDEVITPTPLNYDPIGLDGSGIQATLLQGGYVAVHTFGWTEFEINQATQLLTVTTYGVDFYSEAELSANPSNIITRTPAIVSQFVVTPTAVAGEWIYLPVILKNQP